MDNSDVWSAFLTAILQNYMPATKRFLLKELSLPDEVKEELKRLATEVSMLQVYIGDATQKQRTNVAVRQWLMKLQDVAYDANDLLDECELEAQRQKVIPLARVRNSLSGINPKRSKFLHSISSRLRSMKEEMEKIKNQLPYVLQREQEGPSFTKNESSSFGPLRIIGRDDDKRTLIDWLLKSSVAGESNTNVICIVGIGGLGKTTLAQHVYNDKDVRKTFKPTSWVHVSHYFKGERLMKDILESIGGLSQNSVSLDNLLKDLLDKLKGKKYLLVLDDVWIEDWRLWYKFITPLLQGAMERQILATTRNIETAMAMGDPKIYRLQPISDVDCCSLFFYYMSRPNPNINVEELRSFSGLIAQKCNG